jgi:hypothetical protein
MSGDRSAEEALERVPTKRHWVEAVFWHVAVCLKHGGFLFPRLLRLDDKLYNRLYRYRSGRFDELHCVREQIWVEFNIPQKLKKLWPTSSKKGCDEDDQKKDNHACH